MLAERPRESQAALLCSKYALNPGLVFCIQGLLIVLFVCIAGTIPTRVPTIDTFHRILFSDRQEALSTRVSQRNPRSSSLSCPLFATLPFVARSAPVERINVERRTTYDQRGASLLPINSYPRHLLLWKEGNLSPNARSLGLRLH